MYKLNYWWLGLFLERKSYLLILLLSARDVSLLPEEHKITYMNQDVTLNFRETTRKGKQLTRSDLFPKTRCACQCCLANKTFSINTLGFMDTLPCIPGRVERDGRAVHWKPRAISSKQSQRTRHMAVSSTNALGKKWGMNWTCQGAAEEGGELDGDLLWFY